MKHTNPKDPLAAALNWLDHGHKAALATVVTSWGSAPCPPGSHLCVRDDGHFLGSVSGGCIEGDVITRALELMQGDGEATTLHYDVADQKAWQVGLACGGRIAVRLQPLTAEAARDLRTSLPTAPHLAVIGATHIAQHLCPLASSLDFQVTLIDPRESFASADRFPDTPVLCQWPDEALQTLQLQRHHAVIALTHDPKLDDPALHAALKSPCFYIAALGSRKTHATRLRRLGEAGVTQDRLERIHGPAGLDIGARSPAEIAVSIIAQLIQCRPE